MTNIEPEMIRRAKMISAFAKLRKQFPHMPDDQIIENLIAAYKEAQK